MIRVYEDTQIKILYIDARNEYIRLREFFLENFEGYWLAVIALDNFEYLLLSDRDMAHEALKKMRVNTDHVFLDCLGIYYSL